MHKKVSDGFGFSLTVLQIHRFTKRGPSHTCCCAMLVNWSNKDCYNLEEKQINLFRKVWKNMETEGAAPMFLIESGSFETLGLLSWDMPCKSEVSPASLRYINLFCLFLKSFFAAGQKKRFPRLGIKARDGSVKDKPL